jgi:RNA polymerase sigma-70 factor (ECF subfamily)
MELEAFEALFRQYQADVYSWIVRLVRDRAAAEDLTVETFWRIWKGRARYDPAREFGPWARRVATNVALDYLKTARPELPLRDDFPAPAGADPGITRAIREAFVHLPPRLRAAATLALIEERPHAEIAESLGISVSAAKVRVFRAVRLLRRKLRRLGVAPC